MYGIWYLMIGFGILTILTFVIGLILFPKFDDNYTYEILVTVCFIIAIISFIITIAFLFVGIFEPLKAHADTVYYKELYLTYNNYVEQLATGTNSYGDFAQNGEFLNKITDYNSWLAEARSSQDTYGVFSRYFKEDLSALQYLTLK